MGFGGQSWLAESFDPQESRGSPVDVCGILSAIGIGESLREAAKTDPLIKS